LVSYQLPSTHREILEQIQSSPEKSSAEVLLHTYFEQQAQQYPDYLALVCNEQQMNYGELEQRSNQLAHYLGLQGIGLGTRVGLLLERSIEVYIAILGILKAGAAYVPIDPDYPADRVQYILRDSAAALLLTSATMLSKYPDLPCPSFCFDLQIISAQSTRAIDIEISPTELCYVIYTSGSTGRPKGVMIEHRNAANFVWSARNIYGIRSNDRFYQGFSIAFDASIEEIWLTFAAGATLVVGTAEMVRAGSELAKILTRLGVTVFSCVPTLLSMLQDDLPTVRLLILGGEACQIELIQRWFRADRRILNTYGPTETTVVATYLECDPQKPVTIGQPLPSYKVYILDENLQKVADGETGQIFIGGDCLARGYVNRPELTAEKFIQHPILQCRLYASGDLGAWVNSEIQFLGRADDQVKLRGFRVELSEIESVLMQCSGIQIAIVAIKPGADGVEALIAYLAIGEEATDSRMVDSTTVDLAATRNHLRDRLPGFMMPTCFHQLQAAEIPRLASGKVDRQRLPDPIPMPEAARTDLREPSTPLEAKLVQIWSKLFNTQVSIDDNFFDLGGHSLLVASMVSELRTDPQLQHVSVSDLYHYPSIAIFAEYIAIISIPQAREIKPHPRAGWQFLFTAVCQLGGVYLAQLIFSVNLVLPLLSYRYFQDEPAIAIPVFLGTIAVLYPVMLGLSIASKWILIGKYRSGSYPLWRSYYFRWWLARLMQNIVPLWPLIGTPFLGWYYRLMGAKIGENCYFGTDELETYDLIEIGNDTSLGAESKLLGYEVNDGYLHLGKIEIGDRCFVGVRAALELNSCMEQDSHLADLALLPMGAKIFRQQSWHGSPAKFQKNLEPQAPIYGSNRGRIVREIIQAVGVILLSVLPTIAVLPGILLMIEALDEWDWLGLLAAPVAGMLGILLIVLQVLAFKKIFLPRVRPGIYSLRTGFYLRQWWIDRLMKLSLQWLGTVYGTLYSIPWLRLLGTKIGKQTEISTAANFAPDLVSIGSNAFVADDVSLGAPRVYLGQMSLQRVNIGDKCFIGNSALVPGGSEMVANNLLGCLSIPPPKSPVDTDWVGNPPFRLPYRFHEDKFGQSLTLKPPTWLVCQRLGIEFLRIIMPLTFSAGAISTLIYLVEANLDEIGDDLPWQELIAILPMWSIGIGLLACSLVISCKWMLVGRYKPLSLPLWNNYVWRSELITGINENIAAPWLTNYFLGTPFFAWYLRCLGAKIGKRVFIDSGDITEFDLVKIDDRAALNDGCGLQTHLFEDRVMKMSRVQIGKNCVVGHSSIVLYGTQMEPGSQLHSLSLLMKGEILPAGTHWQGIPAQPLPNNDLVKDRDCPPILEKGKVIKYYGD
jgi:non-ribosomal peptide synthetase-like protein